MATFDIVDLSGGMADFDKLASEVHATAVEKGFWVKDPVMMDKYMAKLALVHSEVTEILEALRKDKSDVDVAFEFADVIIRLLDLWGALVEDRIIGSDVLLQIAFEEKCRKNKERPALHGHKWG